MGSLNFDTDLGGPADTDGDGLMDEVESSGDVDGYPLPEANQDHKDLYIQVYVSKGIEPLTDREKDDLREIWGGMPVSTRTGQKELTYILLRYNFHSQSRLRLVTSRCEIKKSRSTNGGFRDLHNVLCML